MRQAIAYFALLSALMGIEGCAMTGRHFTAADTGLPEGAYLSTVRGRPAALQGPNILDKAEAGLDEKNRAFGVYENAEIEGQLNDILSRLQVNYPMEKKAARVYFTPALGYVASSSHDGGIFLPIPVLAETETEDQLAAVIAHEYAHILLGHHRAGFLKQDWVQLLPVMAMVATEQDDTPTYVALGAAEALHTAVMPAYGRSQEREADLLAIDLLALSDYYDPLAMPRFLDKLATWESKFQERDQTPEIAWSRFIGSSQNSSGDTEIGISQEFADSAISWLEVKRNELQRTHDETPARIAAAKDYLRTKYRDRGSPNSKPVPWAGGGQTMRVLLAEAAAMKVLGTTLEDESATSYVIRRNLRSFAAHGRPSSAYGLWLRQLANSRLSRPDAEMDNLSSVVTYREPLFPQKLGYITEATRVSPEAGAAALAEIEVKYGSSAEYLPFKVYFARASNEPIQASVLALQCMMRVDKGISEACQRADKGDPPW